jgi:hypothetical protein
MHIRRSQRPTAPDKRKTYWVLSYLSSLTPQTNMGASAEGAEMMTFLAGLGPCKWAPALSVVVNTPVDSTTNSAP